MHEVEVEVVQLQVLESELAGREDIIWAVVSVPVIVMQRKEAWESKYQHRPFSYIIAVVRDKIFLPQLGRDENVFSLHHSVSETLLQCRAHLSLIAIDVGTVYMDVALLQSCLHCSTNLTWFGQPRAKLAAKDQTLVSLRHDLYEFSSLAS